MPSRPTDLPDFSDPPLTEVVLGVQFNSLEKFNTPYVGRLWELLQGDYPTAEEHPPIMPVFETFGQPIPLTGGIGFSPSSLLGMPRSFLLNADKTKVLQIQRDRFLHNWRKLDDADNQYPRFEHILLKFEEELRAFARFIEFQGLGTIEPNQCEISYINQIQIDKDQSPYNAMAEIFGSLIQYPDAEEIGPPDDANLLLRYIVKSADQRPIGRLVVSAEPGQLPNRQTIIQLSLTVRGAPEPSDIAGAVAFLQAGRSHIVKTFAAITSPRMHEIWGRKQ